VRPEPGGANERYSPQHGTAHLAYRILVIIALLSRLSPPMAKATYRNIAQIRETCKLNRESACGSGICRVRSGRTRTVCRPGTPAGDVPRAGQAHRQAMINMDSPAGAIVR
jgi:hypothetical protein